MGECVPSHEARVPSFPPKLAAVFSLSLFFLGGGGCTHDTWKFPGQGSKLRHRRDWSHCSDNAQSLTP